MACYIYHDDGAFQEYKRGVTPESTLGHLKDQLMTVEGIFRKLPPSTGRDDLALLNGIRDLLTTAATERSLIAQCRKATLYAGEPHGLKRRGSDLDLATAVEAPEGPRREDGWCRTVAGIVLRVSQSLMREITKDDFMMYVIQWCDSPPTSRLGVAYTDKSVLYGAPGTAEKLVDLSNPSPDTDLYIRIPDPLLDLVLPAIEERLHRYYSESFWANFAVYQCMLAAQTLAKRGINVDRLFIGLSLRIIGWKRLEANRIPSFTGVTDNNFNSILRRSFVFRIKARSPRRYLRIRSVPPSVRREWTRGGCGHQN